jgi:hypothetical protein
VKFLLSPRPHNQHIFLDSNFPNLAILIDKKMEKLMQIKKNCQKIEITNFKGKMLLLMNKK